ncbi:MAG: DNA-3-methyladenine glycosylase [Spirochaetales bacterium]|nr:DNA-3-methyladenine glycosylase [Spirochaetales bacterium]
MAVRGYHGSLRADLVRTVSQACRKACLRQGRLLLHARRRGQELILGRDFYLQDALSAAKAICGKILCVRQHDGSVIRRRITETECYLGEQDTACHAHHGRTRRTEVMYREGGVAYVYLCYGIHDMLNIVTGPAESPQAVLIRSVEGSTGPGRLTKALSIGPGFNGVSFIDSDLIWLETDSFEPASIKALPRVGISYASEEDRARLWRFVI